MDRTLPTHPVTVRHDLLTSAWNEDVEWLETAIKHFTTLRPMVSACHVAFFEVPNDAHLHVNVTHDHATVDVLGWSGPGKVADGLVHNRRFGTMARGAIVRSVRQMVQAASAS